MLGVGPRRWSALTPFTTSTTARLRTDRSSLKQVRAASGSQPWLSASPRVCLHDVPTTLRAGGLPSQSPVTLAASLTDENDKLFLSHAHYVTDQAGEVDVRVAASVGGSYEGVFPAGLLSTLAPAPHLSPATRLYRRNTALPWQVKVQLRRGHQPLVVEDEPETEVVLVRHLRAPGVQRVAVRGHRIRGALYLPPGQGPFPGLIDMFGSVGGLMEFRSAMLASRGFASLALAIFAYDDLPNNPDTIDMDYFEEAVDFILSQPTVIPDRCGAVAVSRGGDVLFNMATLLPQVKAVVGINAITFSGLPVTYRGQMCTQKSINLIEYQPPVFQYTNQGGLHLDISSFFSNDNPLTIPFENADDDTHFLLAVGEDDPWGFKKCIQPFTERMLRHRKNNFETVLYPGTGHLIEPPYGPHIHQSFQRHFPFQSAKKDFEQGVLMHWGGDAQSTCAAQVDLWRRMHTFFMTHVRDESPWYQQHLTTNTAIPSAKL